MPNEVSIKITADDLSGPAFASAMAKMKALKSVADEVSNDRQIDFGMGDALVKLRTIKAEAESISRQRQLDFGIGGDLAKIQALNAEMNNIGRSRQMSLGIGDALAKMELLKHEMDSLSFGHIDTSGIGSSLMALRSKIQSLGIADLADINVPPGRLMSQMQLLKRLVNQAGFTDLLDFNVQTDALARQLDHIGNMTETIPVRFDMQHIPVFGKTQDIFNIPVAFDVGKIPKFGDASSINAESRALEDMSRSIKDVGYASGFSAFTVDEAANAIARYGMLADEGKRYNAVFGMSFADLARIIMGAGSAVGGYLAPPVIRLGGYIRGTMLPTMTSWANTSRGVFVASLIAAGTGIRNLNDNISLGLPMWKNTSNLWFGLGGKIQLFAGALTHVGVPAFIGAASGIHLLVEGIIETIATLGPAVFAIGAFAAAAVDTTNIIYNHFVNMNKVIDMTGQSVYPLTGAFSKMNQAAKPEVYVLLGEGLQIVNKNAGVLQSVALQAGHVIDQLGARFTYATTQGNGFNMFTRNASADLAGWGNMVGNIFGIFGNFLKVMPGYAEVLLNIGNNITHLAEDITGSGLGQDILRIGLAAHGAILYIGLLGTGLAKLISLGLGGLATGLLNVGLALDKIGLAKAGAVMGDFAASAESAAALPWGWITIAAAGIGFLVYQLISAKSASQQFADSVQKNLMGTSLSNLGSTLGSTIANYSTQLAQAQVEYAKALQQFNSARQGVTLQNINQVGQYSQAVDAARASVQDYQAAISIAKGDQATYNQNMAVAVRVFGSSKDALAAFNNAGITSNQFLTKNKQQFAENIIQAQGYNDAIRSLALGTGRYAAAMNALSGPEQFLGDILKNIQAITQAQDALMNEVTQGQSAFDTFGLGQYTLAQNFTAADKAANKVNNTLGKLKSTVSLTGGVMGGTSQASLNLSQAFYTQVGNGQKLIDSLEQQQATTDQLTTATATIAKQMIPFAQNNEAARATLVAMINDAIGPGTVSLKTLDKWVNSNSTSLDGLNNIVAASTVKAGTLANVLQNNLNVQFHQMLLKTSGADHALQIYTSDLVNNQSKTSKGRGDRARLIADLEKTGMSAKDATRYVNGLQGQINSMHGKNVNIGMSASASGTIDAMIKGTGMSPHTAQMILQGGLSAGGKLSGYGGGDRRLYMLEDGEAVVSKESTKRYAGFLGAIGVPGLSSGGVTGKFGAVSNFVEGQEMGFGSMMAKGMLTAIQKMVIDTVIPGNGNGLPITPGPVSASAQVAQNFAKSIMWAYGWNQGQWPYLQSLWNKESGWNSYAVNPSSGAAGIPQNINGWSAYGPGDYQSQIRWGDAYISGRYGNPANAWGHEVAYNWYDQGGVLKPGYTMAYNGTGGNEYVVGPNGLNVCLVVEGGQSPFDKFMAQWIRDFVRTKGGGEVQRAFGSRGK